MAYNALHDMLPTNFSPLLFKLQIYVFLLSPRMHHAFSTFEPSDIVFSLSVTVTHPLLIFFCLKCLYFHVLNDNFQRSIHQLITSINML